MPETADAVIINAGSWTHYSWAIRDALELAAVPAVEVHISDVMAREEWRRFSVFDGLVLGAISGKGQEGYREALGPDRGGAWRVSAGLALRSSRRSIAEAELDCLFVGDLVRPGDSGPDAMANIRWLTGFTGTSGFAIVGEERREFFTDFRYTERAASEVSADFDRVTLEGRLVAELAKRLAGRVGLRRGRDQRFLASKARGRDAGGR